MRKKKVGAIAIKGFALLAVLGTAQHAMAQDVVQALPCSTCPIKPPTMATAHTIRHHTVGLNS